MFLFITIVYLILIISQRIMSVIQSFQGNLDANKSHDLKNGIRGKILLPINTKLVWDIMSWMYLFTRLSFLQLYNFEVMDFLDGVLLEQVDRCQQCNKIGHVKD